ncbi:hypothetical protein KL942_000530 [Ogataea angusta]|uniref:Uncharacterized protein n=1 Tax=Pichia angusta TaxID=870730 RepID=A0ABQ7S347_PICAN|nr:hypothetical protein KL942_000530 [Ogataea angusta]KAG7852413.1 hypothetical protein KL940_000114 [Ogataea angusta]
MLDSTISQSAQQTVQVSPARAHERYNNWRVTRSGAGNRAQTLRQRDCFRFGPGKIRSARAAGHDEKCAFSPVQRGGPEVAGDRTRQTLHLQPAELRELFDINYFANVQLIQHVLKHHRHPNRLHLVCVSSVLGLVSPRGLSGYSATKAGLHTFFMALRHEVPDSVVISTILPGQLTTRMFEDVRVDRNFWAPLVDHCKLAQRIVELIGRGENGFFAFPLYARFIPVLQVLPYSWYRALKKYSRMDDVIEDK